MPALYGGGAYTYDWGLATWSNIVYVVGLTMILLLPIIIFATKSIYKKFYVLDEKIKK